MIGSLSGLIFTYAWKVSYINYCHLLSGWFEVTQEISDQDQPVQKALH